MTVAEADIFPAEEVIAGRLRLSGSDALGPNPWTTPRPEPKEHGLAEAQLDDKHVAEEMGKTERELRQYPYRLVSAYLLPLSFVVAGYLLSMRKIDFSSPPPVEWIAYLGASLILAVIAARFQARQHKAMKAVHDDLVSVGDRREAYLTAQSNWYDEQKRRTTTAFWLNEIPKIAAGKGMSTDDVFSKEVAKLFVAWTWNVKLNQRVHDYGVDIFGRGKEGSAVIQCRHAADIGPNTANVRDLAGSRHAFAADYGLLISIHPPSASPQNEFYSDKGQLEFWHLGHVLEQCISLYKQRTGKEAPADPGRAAFLDADGTPVNHQVEGRAAAE